MSLWIGLRIGLLAGAASALRIPTQSPDVASLSRRSLIAQTCGALVAAPLAGPLAAVADVRGANQERPRSEKEINKFLANQGFPPMPVPSGTAPLVEYIGTAPPANIDGSKSRDRAFSETLLVRFVFPTGWLVETPSITENGEAGSIGASNYQKGDSIKFAASALPKGKGIDSVDKDFYKTFISSQMSGDVYQDIKIKKVKPVTQADGTSTVEISFVYELLTRAGFSVNRKGVASATVIDDALVGIVCATTEDRYKKLEDQFKASVDSFRAYKVKAPAFVGSII